MSQGPRSSPPQVTGYTHQRWLGGGGFADVFLYRSETVNELEVAVKVLIHSASDPGEFRSEANQMARVSSHPFIVDVHSAGVAPDGRPYLVMKYFGDDNLERRVRQEGRLGVEEVLRLGVQISSAVQTAHLAGILHRDIKPANVLVDPYGHPGLADFGVAGAMEGGEAQAALSPQYTAPEIHDGSSPGTERSDVYALAATLYRLVAGRAPFEYPNQDNAYNAVVPRVLSHPTPPIGVPDVPGSLENLLRQALSKDPAQRPPTAEAFARALQTIERERGLTPTPLAMVALGSSRPPQRLVDDDDDRTSLGRVQVVDPGGSRLPGIEPPIRYVEVAAPNEPLLVEPPRASSHTQRRPGSPPVPEPAPLPARPARPAPLRPLLAAGAALVLVVGAIIFVAGRSPEPEPPDPTSTTRARPSVVFEDVPPVPRRVEVRIEGSSAVVTWDVSDSQPGDTWRVRRVDVTPEVVVEADRPPARFEGVTRGAKVCADVIAVRGSQQSEPSSPCTPASVP